MKSPDFVVVHQREELTIPVLEVMVGCMCSEVVVNGRIDLSGSVSVNNGIDPLNAGQTAREFPELTLISVYMEELISVRAVLDLRDLALPTGEFDVVPSSMSVIR